VPWEVNISQKNDRCKNVVCPQATEMEPTKQRLYLRTKPLNKVNDSSKIKICATYQIKCEVLALWVENSGE